LITTDLATQIFLFFFIFNTASLKNRSIILQVCAKSGSKIFDEKPLSQIRLQKADQEFLKFGSSKENESYSSKI